MIFVTLDDVEQKFQNCVFFYFFFYFFFYKLSLELYRPFLLYYIFLQTTDFLLHISLTFYSYSGITDSEEKELYMVDILHQLPKPNKMTALYLFEHLRRSVLHYFLRPFLKI